MFRDRDQDRGFRERDWNFRGRDRDRIFRERDWNFRDRDRDRIFAIFLLFLFLTIFSQIITKKIE